MASYEDFLMELQQKCSNPNYIKYIDDFIKQGKKVGLITRDNWSNVVEKLRKVDRFADLHVQNRGIYGATFPSQGGEGLTVCINPDLSAYKREQYAFHELAHVVMDGSSEYIEKNLRETMGSDISSQNVARITRGYTVIEEAVAQEVSEEMIASLYNRERVPLSNSPSQDSAIPGIQFRSNYDFYGLYQPVGIKFARTLRGIGNQIQRSDDGENIYLHSLCQRAFDGDFAKGIVDEYSRDGHYTELMMSFNKLGNVYDVKQATFGTRNGVNLTPENLRASAQSYLDAMQTFGELEDHRPKREDVER